MNLIRARFCYHGSTRVDKRSLVHVCAYSMTEGYTPVCGGFSVERRLQITQTSDPVNCRHCVEEVRKVLVQELQQ